MAGLVGLVASGTSVVISVLDAGVLPDDADSYALDRHATVPSPAESAESAESAVIQG